MLGFLFWGDNQATALIDSMADLAAQHGVQVDLSDIRRACYRNKRISNDQLDAYSKACVKIFHARNKALIESLA